MKELTNTRGWRAGSLAGESTVRSACAIAMRTVVPALTFAVVGCSTDSATVEPRIPIVLAEIDLSIGRLDGPEEYEFGRVSGMAFAPSDRILIADRQAGQVRVFDDRGEFQFAFGHFGSGPGEVRGLCCLAIDPQGLLWVRDGGNARYNVYRLSDTAAFYVSSRRMSHTSGNFWVTTTFAESGELIDVGYVTDPMSGRQLVRFFLDSTSAVIREDTVYAPPAESLATHEVQFTTSQGSRATRYFYQPYGPNHLVAHSPTGGWAEAVSSRYAVRWHGPGDTFTHDLARELSGPALSPDETERARSRLEARLSPLGLDISDLPFRIPDRKTPLRYLQFDSAGRLWVFLSFADGGPQQADVYSRAGELLFTVQWPMDVDFRFGVLQPTRALGLTSDSLGVQRVVRLHIGEPPG